MKYSLSKREALKTLGAGALAIVATTSLFSLPAMAESKSTTATIKEASMTTITLPALPYAYDALEPHIGKQTVELHHSKHQKAYVDKTNELTKGTDLEGKTLEEIVKATYKDASKAVLFNNAAQAWNHIVYWENIAPNGGGKPTGEILKKIEEDFGSYDNFVAEFKAAGLGQFGSGWVWLALDNGKLKITKTPNAENPLAQGLVTILGVDVWEHAYYLDYQNRRADYLSIFLDHLVNWDYAEKALKSAK